LKLEITNLSKAPVDKLYLKHVAKSTAQMFPEFFLDKSVSLVFVDEAKMQVLNRDYRGKDYATNILSFPLEGPQGEEGLLGEIFLCYNVIQDEAKQNKENVQDLISHLLVHGLFHLVGLDHETEEDFQKMKTCEDKILDVIYNESQK
jgi:probable rRNA maturation factor